jgi:hypothetical protein
MLTFLHVSDVHFGGADYLGAQPLITEALIKTVHNSGIEPDLCIFTGDLAFDGSPNQMTKGETWLRSLIRPEWKTELIVIPGNHDIERRHTSPNLFRSIAAQEKAYNEWRVDAKVPHFNSFFAWHGSARKRLPLRGEWNSPFGFRYQRSASSIPVHIIGLNSALFSCNDSDAKQLVIDTKTLTTHIDAAGRAGGLIVAAAHHPLDDLVSWNKAHIERFMSQETGAHLFLHGHLHEQMGTSKFDTTGRRLTTLAAGASYQDAPWPYAFSFYFVDFAGHAIHVQAYSYSPNSGEWTQDTKNSRKIMADLPALPKQKSPQSKFKSGTGSEQRRKHDEVGRVELGQADETTPTAEKEADIAKDGSKSAPAKSEHVVAGEDGNQVNREACWRFREAAREVQQRVLPFFRESPEIFESSYALKYRIKEFDSIVRKLKTNLAEDQSYSLDRMADICGFRIITLYQDQIPPIPAHGQCRSSKGAFNARDIHHRTRRRSHRQESLGI